MTGAQPDPREADPHEADPHEADPISQSGEFDLVLRPHRSLSPAGFWVIMTIMGAWSFIGGIVFWLVGAWPVIGFVGLDFIIVWWAFRASYGDARTRERLRHASGILTVERMDKRGAVECQTLPTQWLRITLEPTPAGPRDLVLSSHGRRLVIGAFLPPEERVVLAGLLDEALARARRPPAAATQPG